MRPPIWSLFPGDVPATKIDEGRITYEENSVNPPHPSLCETHFHSSSDAWAKDLNDLWHDGLSASNDCA